MGNFAENNRLSAINRERVRLHRARRKAVGLQEMKLWLKASDVPRVLALLQPFIKTADNLLYEKK